MASNLIETSLSAEGSRVIFLLGGKLIQFFGLSSFEKFTVNRSFVVTISTLSLSTLCVCSHNFLTKIAFIIENGIKVLLVTVFAHAEDCYMFHWMEGESKRGITSLVAGVTPFCSPHPFLAVDLLGSVNCVVGFRIKE